MSDIVQVTTEAKVLKIIGLMIDGKTKKAACEEMRISTQTFDRHVAASPELVEQVKVSVRSAFADRLDTVNQNQLKNLDAMLEFSARLRARLELNPELEFDDSLKAFQALLKMQAEMNRTLDIILPPTKVVVAPPDPGMGDDRALALLSQLKGAKYTVTKTIEVPEEERQVVEGTSNPAD